MADNVTIKFQMLMRRKGFPERVYRIVATDGDITWLRPRDRTMDDDLLISRVELDKQWEPYEPPPCDNWAAIHRARLGDTDGVMLTLTGQQQFISADHLPRFLAHLDMVMTLDEKHEAYDVMRMLRHA